MPRQAAEIRRAATRRIKDMIAVFVPRFAQRTPPAAYQQALVTVAALAGTLLLARAVDDSDLADALLEAAHQQLIPDSG